MEVKDADNYSSIQPKSHRVKTTDIFQQKLKYYQITQSRLGIVEEITQVVQKPNCKK